MKRRNNINGYRCSSVRGSTATGKDRPKRNGGAIRREQNAKEPTDGRGWRIWWRWLDQSQSLNQPEPPVLLPP